MLDAIVANEGEPDVVQITLTEVRQAVLDQTDLYLPEDIIPVPCNPGALSMGYALEASSGVMLLTRFVGPETLLVGDRNTIVFESDPILKKEVFKLFATNHSPESQANCLCLSHVLFTSDRCPPINRLPERLSRSHHGIHGRREF